MTGLNEVIPDFLMAKEVEEGCSPRTVKAYRYDLHLFVQILGEISLETIKVFHVRKFLQELYNRNYTKTALARKIACLKTFFQFCFENEMIEKNPMITIKSPKIRMEEALPKFLTREEMDQVLQLLPKIKGKTRAWASRLELMIRLLYASMGRISEICSIRIQDIDSSRSSIKVRGKGNKERYIPLDPQTMGMLQEYITTRLLENPKNTEFLFVNLRGDPLQPRSVQRDLHALKTILGLPEDKKFTPHVFRHTGATHLRQNGMDISELQDLLGHSSPNTTRIYAKNDLTQLHQSYMLYHPLADREQSKK
jgi:integrase/recombinase XerC